MIAVASFSLWLLVHFSHRRLSMLLSSPDFCGVLWVLNKVLCLWERSEACTFCEREDRTWPHCSLGDEGHMLVFSVPLGPCVLVRPATRVCLQLPYSCLSSRQGDWGVPSFRLIHHRLQFSPYARKVLGLTQDAPGARPMVQCFIIQGAEEFRTPTMKCFRAACGRNLGGS